MRHGFPVWEQLRCQSFSFELTAGFLPCLVHFLPMGPSQILPDQLPCSQLCLWGTPLRAHTEAGQGILLHTHGDEIASERRGQKGGRKKGATVWSEVRRGHGCSAAAWVLARAQGHKEPREGSGVEVAPRQLTLCPQRILNVGKAR